MVTALPLQQGKINVTAGTFTGITIVHCEVSGGIKLIWNDDTEDLYPMVAGDDRFVYEAKAVVVDSGTFTLAKA